MEKGRGKSDEALSSSPQGESSLDNGAVAGDKGKKEKGPHETALRLLLLSVEGKGAAVGLSLGIQPVPLKCAVCPRFIQGRS